MSPLKRARKQLAALYPENGHVTFFITLGMVLLTAWLALHLSRPRNAVKVALEDDRQLHTTVALIESGGSHEEVVSALYYALGSVAGVHTSMYFALPRFGIENVYASLKRRYKLSPYEISK